MKQLEIQKKEKSSPEESETQYHFQGQSARSQHWFDIYPVWIEENFMTRETDFFKSVYLKRIPGQTNKDRFTISSPIVATKGTSQFQLDPDSPILAHQKHYNLFLLFQ